MSTADIEEKFGKVYTRMEAAKGDIKRLLDAVFGNGVPGHEKRIGDLEEKWANRRDSCPFISDKQNRQIVIGLWINGLMMLTGFIAVIITLG